MDIHSVHNGKLHRPKAISDEPILNSYNRTENIQVASRGKNNLKINVKVGSFRFN
jgi:hypothetical protein